MPQVILILIWIHLKPAHTAQSNGQASTLGSEAPSPLAKMTTHRQLTPSSTAGFGLERGHIKYTGA
ncbi:hypothetical protein TWF506_006828 [Arthrobotrys conoides]|uniref:Uncharacterized protein n=1 Tax=Arthrobotrys conoides TaxID=74498 RepID=A0AAN8RP94_9PEZI